MDFQIVRQKDKVMVRLKADASDSDSIAVFCNEYKSHLLDAQKNNVKLSVLFDLRGATFVMLKSSSSRLKAFFGTEIQTLSDATLSSCIVVVSSKPLATAIQVILQAFPGKVPTSFTDVFPSKNNK